MRSIKGPGLFIIVIVLLLFGGVWIFRDGNTKVPGKKAAPSSFNKHRYSWSDPASLWIVVNKLRPLSPKTYAPAHLIAPGIPLRLASTADEMQVSSAMAGPLKTLVDGASKDGIKLMLASGYRSYDFQVNLYNTYVQQQGKAEADKQSARPGFSEHQTGLAADLEPTSRTCEVEQCFAATPEGTWLAANAYKYGFIIRYPQGKEQVTGYEYEPWHVRYVGPDLASEMHREHAQTLEEFFGLPAAPNYQ